ncbi:MAG: ABC transporter substrate-binding protein [Phormidesmis sp.]
MLPISWVRFVSMLLVGLSGALSISLVSCENNAPTSGSFDQIPFVAVTQIVEYPAWNAVRDGIKDELAAAGYTAGDSLRWEWLSAQNNPVTAARIAGKYAQARPDVIVAITPLSAQSVAVSTRKTPVIFAAVDDPIGTQLVEDMSKPGQNVSGVRDLSSIDQQLALIKEILPEASILGVIHSTNSQLIEVDLIKEQAAQQGFTGVREAEVSLANADSAARSLASSVDAIYVPGEEEGSLLEAVLQVGQYENVPVFSGDMEAAEKGAIANISFTYYDMGRQTGAMVTKVLKGSRLEDLPVEFANANQLSVNPTAAAAMGVVIPPAVIERADRVFE